MSSTDKDKFDMKSQLEKTLYINGEMQNQLLLVREKLERLLANVKDTFKANEILIKDGVKKRRRGFGIKGAYLRGGTFYFKGNLFFKDTDCRNCPNNDDYKKRIKENEIFPMDFNLKARHMWSTTDKQGIILGIKEQIIDYLTQPSKKRNATSKEINSEKLTKLLKMVGDDFCIDWDYISSCNLSYRHSAKNCEAIWNLFLHPSLNRSAWSQTENHKLLEVARKFNFQNWQEIAKECGQRSDFQCFVQYKNHVCHMLPESYIKWKKEDDKLLLEAVAKNTVNGNINWSNVQSYFPHKAKTTIHSRYNMTMNPNIIRGVLFTPEEDVLLIAALKEYGKFSCIPRSLFPNRTLIQLRSHYKNTLCKRHNTQPWTLEDDIKLMEFVNTNGTKSWLECEKVLENRHARHSCRTRYLTIQRHLTKNPDCSIETLPRKKVYKAPKSSVNIQNWKKKVDELSSNNNSGEQNITANLEQKPVKGVKRKRQKSNDAEKTTKKIKLETAGKVKSCKELTLNKQKKEKNDKPYFLRLSVNEKECYNFFKYAYNFKINQHPCQNIEINQDYSMVLAALKPLRTSGPIYDYATGLEKYINPSIIRNPTILPSVSFNAIDPLPPSWSTAMGFRALCINTTDISTNLPSDYTINVPNNDHIQRFRKRLRLIFYSTVLLSRLNPSMVGIDITELKPLEPKQLEINRYCKRETISENTNNSVNINETIKTEMEM